MSIIFYRTFFTIKNKLKDSLLKAYLDVFRGESGVNPHWTGLVAHPAGRAEFPLQIAESGHHKQSEAVRKPLPKKWAEREKLTNLLLKIIPWVNHVNLILNLNNNHYSHKKLIFNESQIKKIKIWSNGILYYTSCKM